MKVLGENNNTCIAGGRSDNLSQTFGKNCAAIGWAGGIDRLSIVLEQVGFVPKEQQKAAIAIASLIQPSELEQYGSQIRKHCIQLHK